MKRSSPIEMREAAAVSSNRAVRLVISVASMMDFHDSTIMRRYVPPLNRLARLRGLDRGKSEFVPACFYKYMEFHDYIGPPLESGCSEYLLLQLRFPFQMGVFCPSLVGASG
jgi:hypothetical protein